MNNPNIRVLILQTAHPPKLWENYLTLTITKT